MNSDEATRAKKIEQISKHTINPHQLAKGTARKSKAPPLQRNLTHP